ncbi:MAG: NAD-binding protein, partial [Sulfolobales archaeon]
MKIAVVGVNDYTAGLVRELVERGHQVAVFDDTKEGVEKLEAELDITGAVVDLLNFDGLEEFGFSKADVLVLAHREDTVNIVLSMYAKMVNIPKTFVVSKSKRIAEVLSRLGLASGVVTISDVVKRKLTSALSGVEPIELPGDYVVASIDTKVMVHLVGMSIADFRDRWNLSVLKIVDRNGSLKEPVDDYVIKEGDVLVVFGER